MKLLFFVFVSAATSLCNGQSTFSFSTGPRQQQYVPQQYPVRPGMPYSNGYPYPMQGGYPMQGVPQNSGGGGIPIGAIIGLVGGLVNSAVANNAVQRQQRALQQDREGSIIDINSGNRVAANGNLANINTGAGNDSYVNQNGDIYKKINEYKTESGTKTVYASGPFDKVRDGIPNGIVLENGNIKSPYSDYTIDLMQFTALKPDHIVTDPNVKKNFRIPSMQYGH